MFRVLLVTGCTMLYASCCFAQSKSTSTTRTVTVTSPIQLLGTELGTLSDSTEPAQSGTLQPDKAADIIKAFGAKTDMPTIIHILRWSDSNHSTTDFEKWYFYDPSPPKGGFYLQSAQQIFQRTAIPGYSEFQFIYIHINHVLVDGIKEWAALPEKAATLTASISPNGVVTSISVADGGSGYKAAPLCTLSGGGGSQATCSAAITSGKITSVTVNSGGEGYTTAPNVVLGNVLLHPISYSVTVTKAQTQFIQDLKTALQIVGFPDLTAFRAAPAPPNYGYFAIGTFKSQWTTSTITIAASLDSASPPKNQGKAEGSTSDSLASTTYTNEKSDWKGLSAGVQITSYKDVTYQSSSGTLVPSTITSQNVYFFFDAYYPRVLPSLASFRYIPHPFFGLPIKGKVLRHTMLGVGIGLNWLEPFGGVVFDTEHNQVKGPNVDKTSIKYQYVFGLKVSMIAVGKALLKK